MLTFVNVKIGKIISIVLANLYLVLTIGIGLRAHYCHGDLSSVSYLTSLPDCGCGEEGKEMSCCATIDRFIQLDEDVVITDISFDFPVFAVPSNEIVVNDEFDEASTVVATVPASDNSPPIYLMNSSLIYYA